jgi:PST family polysaccharide transporter
MFFGCRSQNGLVLIKAPLLAFAWMRLAEVAIVGIAYVYFYRLTGNKIQDWQFSWNRGKELLRESWPILLSGLAVYFVLENRSAYAGCDE